MNSIWWNDWGASVQRNGEKAFAVIQKMKQRKIQIPYFLEPNVIVDVYKAVGEPLDIDLQAEEPAPVDNGIKEEIGQPQHRRRYWTLELEIVCNILRNSDRWKTAFTCTVVQSWKTLWFTGSIQND